MLKKKTNQKTRNAKKIKMVGGPSGLRTIMKYAVFLKCFGCKTRFKRRISVVLNSIQLSAAEMRLLIHTSNFCPI